MMEGYYSNEDFSEFDEELTPLEKIAQLIRENGGTITPKMSLSERIREELREKLNVEIPEKYWEEIAEWIKGTGCSSHKLNKTFFRYEKKVVFSLSQEIFLGLDQGIILLRVGNRNVKGWCTHYLRQMDFLIPIVSVFKNPEIHIFNKYMDFNKNISTESGIELQFCQGELQVAIDPHKEAVYVFNPDYIYRESDYYYFVEK